jgi:hypothetical protein
MNHSGFIGEFNEQVRKQADQEKGVDQRMETTKENYHVSHEILEQQSDFRLANCAMQYWKPSRSKSTTNDMIFS